MSREEILRKEIAALGRAEHIDGFEDVCIAGEKIIRNNDRVELRIELFDLILARLEAV